MGLKFKYLVSLMCGITGFCDFNKRLTKDNLISATNVLQHRGPDSGNVAIFNTEMQILALAIDDYQFLISPVMAISPCTVMIKIF